jgi:hypothetical protein
MIKLGGSLFTKETKNIDKMNNCEIRENRQKLGGSIFLMTERLYKKSSGKLKMKCNPLQGLT